MAGRLTRKMRGLLLTWSRGVMIAVAIAAAVIVTASYLVDEGEIVELQTVDANGRSHVTELWIVNLPAGPYLRAADPGAAWLERLQRNPAVVVERDGGEARYRALPEDDGAIREQVNGAMSAKYGLADRIWARVSDHGRSVPIRLEPAGAASARAGH